MSGKTTVILPTPGQFRRTVRKDGVPVLDESGNPRVLVFNSRQGVELTSEELEAVRDDIGNVLHIAKKVEEKGDKTAFKIDHEATRKFKEETGKRRAAEAKAAAQEKAVVVKKPAAKVVEHATPHKDIEHKPGK